MKITFESEDARKYGVFAAVILEWMKREHERQAYLKPMSFAKADVLKMAADMPFMTKKQFTSAIWGLYYDGEIELDCASTKRLPNEFLFRIL